MIHFDLPKQKSSIIKVLGVGGGGSNAVNFMFSEDIEGVDFIVCNTDSKALEQSNVPNKIQLGPHLTQGLGAGANPEVGKGATQESLEEIKRILEVNTKMAFITAGMGGGTGTGGAPIIAQICRELGILTVGIVTTPFGFEGPRRLIQAEEGIKKLQPYVDTLLVISNDKLRMQYGNLKMKEAFSKADNVLATAAKCITDIINSKGHIIVDFADVCTVMKNGGVAILGNSAAEGEDRAQRAIEEALNSPLLNDNDISGAKWILININSAEGDFECTMDEIEIINNHLRMQAGDKTDVIVGMGYDNSLERKIGITLIATGFEQKNPFSPVMETTVKKAEPKEEKIVMTLGVVGEEKKIFSPQHLLKEEPVIDVYAPTLAQPVQVPETPVAPVVEEKPVVEMPLMQTLQIQETPVLPVQPVKEPEPAKEEEPVQPVMQYIEKPAIEEPVYTSRFLSRPSNIYAEPPVNNSAEKMQPKETVTPPKKETTIDFSGEEPLELELVIKDEQPPARPVTQQPVITDISCNDEEEEQKKRAAERIHKLRNLSYNMNSQDMNNEFETVPAYVRKNIDLFGGNKLTTVEEFYSKYAVKKDENNETQISTINTFLDGKKPD